MPRSPRFRIARLADLHRQIAFASDDALRRQLHAAEILLDEIEPAQTYEAEAVVHRITGFRAEAERAEGGELLVGEALIEDLTTFTLRLSQAIELGPEDRPGGADTVEALAAKLGVTQRTIQRWRRLGLALHWIVFDGRRRVACYRASLESFRRRGSMQHRGRPLVRIDAMERTRLVAEAQTIRESAGGSLSSVAAEVARRHGRAHETVRQLLTRHDARAQRPIFAGSAADRRPLAERQRRLIERAWRVGVPLHRIAQRLERSLPAVHRQLMIRRRERLVGLRLHWIELPTFELAEADEVILAPGEVRRDLRRLPTEGDLMSLLTALRATAAPLPKRSLPAEDRRRSGRRRLAADDRLPAPEEASDAADEALLAAWNFLKRRAARGIADLGQVPKAGAVDAVERDLRWASMVQRTLLATALAEGVRHADVWAGRRIETLPAEHIRELLRVLVPVCAKVIDRVDPSRGQRLSRMVTLDVDRALARRTPTGGGGLAGSTASERSGGRARASAGHVGSVAAPTSLFDRLSPWQAWLDPPREWSARLARLPEAQRLAVTAMHGLDGSAPQLISEIARRLRVGPSAAARLAAEGEAGLRGWGAARRSGGP